MSITKLIMESRDEITISRLISLVTRRIKNLPHTFLWHTYRLLNTENIQRIRALHNTCLNERCFILGNGPSLARTDLTLLRNEKTFGLNRIYLISSSVDYQPSYYVCMNSWVIQQSQNEIEKIRALKFINWRNRHLFHMSPETIFLHESFFPRFTHDISSQIWGGATVTFAAMQIAYFLGFQQVILIGVDHRFKSKGTPNKVVVADEKDQDHFHPKYFADGTRWQLPDLRTSEYAFHLAKVAFEEDGREIIDATIDGALQVFPKIPYQKLF